MARRRRRRDPHRQHAGSLEDLSAIDETGGGSGRAKSSVSESGKHGGSLQNINQEGGGDFRPPVTAVPAAPLASGRSATPAAPAVTASAPAAAGPPPTVIDIDSESAASRVSARGRTEPPAECARPAAAAEEARADATVEFPLRLDPVSAETAGARRLVYL